MQSLVFLTYFFQKLSKENLWGMGSTPLPPLGTGRVKSYPGELHTSIPNLTLSGILTIISQCSANKAGVGGKFDDFGENFVSRKIPCCRDAPNFDQNCIPLLNIKID